MPIIDPNLIEVDKPELIFGIVSAVGTPLRNVCRIITEELSKREYSCEEIRLSRLLNEGYRLQLPLSSTDGNEFERINGLMDRGNELRQLSNGGEALALLAAAHINNKRPEEGPRFMSGKAHLLCQLKHPDEVYWLRKIYSLAFHLVGVYCPVSVRKQNLIINHGMSSEQADHLIKRDEEEKDPYGQHLRDAFYLADIFVELNGYDETSNKLVTSQIQRYLKLLFAEEIITPTVDEFGMHLAYTASLRSADLSRQVGAAILSRNREVISLGSNEVPTPKGGQYWEDEKDDNRDFKMGYDSNTIMKKEILSEILEISDKEFLKLGEGDRNDRLEELIKRLSSTRLMNLTEFGRAVHAEMEAIIAAGRIGVSVRECNLYTTTFPCHNCAKHIVNAGIKRLIYIEPYPKSMAKDLHNDSIAFSDENDDDNNIKTRFKPFVGVGPRMYWTLFSILAPDGSRLKRKNKSGEVNKSPLGLRIKSSPLTYIDLESLAAVAAARIGKLKQKEETENGWNTSE
jgi:deoxycytidylate deaminase